MRGEFSPKAETRGAEPERTVVSTMRESPASGPAARGPDDRAKDPICGMVIGKAGALYLVHKTDAEHMELLTLDDLRSAKFYPDPESAPVPDAPPTAERRVRLSETIRRTVNPRRE